MIIQISPEIIEQGFIELDVNNFDFDVAYENLYLVQGYEYIVEKMGSKARIIFSKNFYPTMKPRGLIYITWASEAF